jgi:hypothetical protein
MPHGRRDRVKRHNQAVLITDAAEDPEREIRRREIRYVAMMLTRALCLIALGRADAAEKEIAVVVAANPFFMPDPGEVAPRVVAMFAETRRKLLPQMIRRLFGDARTLFRDGEREKASALRSSAPVARRSRY